MRQGEAGKPDDGSAKVVISTGLGKPSSSPFEWDKSFGNFFKWATGFIGKTSAICELEVRKLCHDPIELLTRAVQPMLWLVIFGQAFTRARAIPTGNLRYLDFLTPGILAQSVLFISVFYGISLIWERDLGILHKMLVSPAPRSALVTGKALSAGVRGLSQAVIVFLLALVLHVRLTWNPLALLGTALVVVLGAAFFSTFSLIIACLVRSRERFMGVGQMMTMPLFFASNAIYPIEMMPAWLRIVARANPLSYEVDALRALMLPDRFSSAGLRVDFAVLVLATVVATTLAAWLYPRAVT